MCGIFACLNCSNETKTIQNYFNKIRHRGPDESSIVKKGSHVFGFHRLAINDVENGNQPFETNGLIMICNGEIYNHKTLESNYKLHSQLTTESDCECIIHMFNAGMSSEQIAAQLDAEFAYIVYDEKTNIMYAARDAFGVRPLFWGIKDNMIAFASEMKAINYCDHIEPFLPGHSMTLNLNTTMSSTYVKSQFKRYYHFPDMINLFSREDAMATIRTLFINAVKKRVMSDRPIGCLLSGGLDSSLVAAVLNKFVPNVHLFSVGLEGSVDVAAAKKVAKFLNNSNHHILTFTVDEGANAIESVIEQLESYDVTTVRASTPQYLLAKYISTNTDVVVIYSGEGSDELNAGYQYSKRAPNAQELLYDGKSLLSELYMFDNLRTDRTTAAWGLEVRVPFLDKEFVNYILSVNPEFKSCDTNTIEKKLLRDAFVGWLPDEILYRPKEAFSDAVSSKEVSWYKSLQAKINEVTTDDDLLNHKYTFNPPQTKEALYYRNIFNKYYSERDHVISKLWMPKWQTETLTDPSATVLSCYSVSK